MGFLTDKITRNKLDGLIRAYQTEEPVLDVGGSRFPDYQRYFPKRTVVDIHPGQGVDVIASVYDLPFKEGEFPLVLCIAVLEHLEDPFKAVAEMRRVLKLGGKIIISVPFLFPMHDVPGDYWRFTKYGLKKLFSEGWEIDVLRAEATTQEMMAILLQRIGFQTKMKFNNISKFFVFLLAKVIQHLPNMITRVYGDIGKKMDEPDAFTNSFFLVARKIQ